MTGIQFWVTDYLVTFLGADPNAVVVGFALASLTGPTAGVFFGGTQRSHALAAAGVPPSSLVCVAMFGRLGCGQARGLQGRNWALDGHRSGVLRPVWRVCSCVFHTHGALPGFPCGYCGPMAGVVLWRVRPLRGAWLSPASPYTRHACVDATTDACSLPRRGSPSRLCRTTFDRSVLHGP